MTVSVIIPTYNRARLVQETIDSVLNQTYNDYEIIVIDDGSTDDTEIQLKRYGDKITYIKQENRGLNAARNKAIKMAKGDYIALLDSDDLWLDFKLELETELLDHYPDRGFVFSDFFVLKPDDRRIPHGLHNWFNENPDWDEIFSSSERHTLNISSKDLSQDQCDIYFGDIYYTSLFGPRVLPSASLYRKSMAEGFLTFNEHNTACGDWEFFARLSRKHNPIFIDMETALNRSHEDAVRLTRVDHKIQLHQRLELINSTWKSDTNFYTEHKIDVDDEEVHILMRLIKFQLSDGVIKDARNSLRKINNIGGSTAGKKLLIYKLLAYTPGISTFIRVLRKLKRLIH